MAKTDEGSKDSKETIQPQHTSKPKVRKKWLVWITIGFLIIAAILLTYWALVGRFYESTDDAYVGGNTVQVMSQIGGHVTGILADETDLVKKGQPLIYLDKTDTEVAFNNAKANLALIVRQVAQFYKNVDQLKANVAVAEDNLKKATEDYERRITLVPNKSITKEDLRHYKLTMDSSKDALELAQHQLAAAIALVKNTDLYHHPQILQAAENVRTAFLNLERTTIYSPVTGYVAKRPVQLGQQINNTTSVLPLMVIVPLDDLWVDANFKESQLKNIRIGQPAEIYSDLYGSDVTFHGIVQGLSPGTGTSFDILPPQNATGNWIKIVQRLPVRIKLDIKELEKHPLRIGLSMSVTVDTHDRQGKVLSLIPQQTIIYETENFASDLEKANTIIEEILHQNSENIRLENDVKQP